MTPLRVLFITTGLAGGGAEHALLRLIRGGLAPKQFYVLGVARKAKSDGEIAMENQLLNKLIDDNTFSVPSSLVKRQIHLMTENAKAKLLQKGFKKEELDKKDDEFTGRFKDDALKQVRLLFILDSIDDKVMRASRNLEEVSVKN